MSTRRNRSRNRIGRGDNCPNEYWIDVINLANQQNCKSMVTNALVDAPDPVQCVEDQASIDVVSPTFTPLFSGNATGIGDLVPTRPIGQCDFTGSSHAFSTQLIKDGLNEIRVRGSATSNGSSTSADVLIGFIDSVTK